MLREEKIILDDLLLDPNNYRFQDIDGFVFASEERFHEQTVQDRAFQRLKTEESLQLLKESILKNGYIPVERIVVRPCGGKKDTYIVVEGNRRVASAKWIVDDYNAGVEIPANVLDSIKELPVIISEEQGVDEIFRASLMGIRHVSGIKDWGGYQRAKLVSEMRDRLELPPSEVASRLGMSSQEVTRRYRAFKALEQMKDDEIYGEYAKPALYPVFHEAVSLPAVKDWLAWDETNTMFMDEDQRENFYLLITPTQDDEGSIVSSKIKSYSQVRELRAILGKVDAKQVLLDPAKPFEEALAIAKQDELSKAWKVQVAEAISALNNIGIKELKAIGDDEKTMIEELKSVAKERLSDIESLKG